MAKKNKQEIVDPKYFYILFCLNLIFILVRVHYIKEDYSKIQMVMFVLWLIVQFWGYFFMLYLLKEVYNGIVKLNKSSNYYINQVKKKKRGFLDYMWGIWCVFLLILIWITILILVALSIIIFVGGTLYLFNYTDKYKINNVKSVKKSTFPFNLLDDC